MSSLDTENASRHDRWRVILVAAWVFAVPACGAPTLVSVTDTVTFRDRARVSMVSAGGAASGGAPVGDGAVLGSGRTATGEGASTEFVVHATRAREGTPELHWATGASLVDGEYREVVPLEPLVFTEAVSPEADHPWTFHDDRFHLDACTFLQEASSGGGYVGHMPVPRHHLGYRIGVALPCRAGQVRDAVLFGLETPWFNIAEIRRTMTYRADARFLTTLGTSGAFMLGALVALVAGSNLRPGSDDVRDGLFVGGGISAAVSLGLLLGTFAFQGTWEESQSLPLR